MENQLGYGRLKGKVAIVTGSSRGIGLAIAVGYAREGADIVLVSRHGGALVGPAEEMRALGVRVLPVEADVSQPADVQRVVAGAEDTFGRLDVMVCNAGIQIRGPSAEMSLESWQRVLDTNITGVFLCCQVAGKAMLRQGSGSIINIASLSSYVGMPERAPYGTAKTAVVGLTRALATEWARRGVRVNAIAPGYIRTEMVQRGIEEGILDEASIVARTPMGRMGMPEDMVGPAVFLASSDSAFVTGQVIVADGGFLAFGYIKPGEGDY